MNPFTLCASLYVIIRSFMLTRGTLFHACLNGTIPLYILPHLLKSIHIPLDNYDDSIFNHNGIVCFTDNKIKKGWLFFRFVPTGLRTLLLSVSRMIL